MRRAASAFVCSRQTIVWCRQTIVWCRQTIVCSHQTITRSNLDKQKAPRRLPKIKHTPPHSHAPNAKSYPSHSTITGKPCKSAV
ncbi:hypothetical protein GCWU000325_01327 [Alloprevotella tannerae ATCC 51259]|uniref:Uncharacterized protein n=1 Tax=Alloprevotella tannerae ATCC 51259 TaxID=626522 RepID=C9LGI4_9BACT|nr:hypothetical protein GCWU000325_01327 [Alloprevotella tannerae ATCC 51259]